jgi:coproporphyrinogen III oxidase
VQELGSSFPGIYIQLIENNKNTAFSENEKHWQALRRGRYVEFNLVYDKGTKFGFETGGRTESILMSLPPLAEWVYQYKSVENSAEAQTLALLKKGISWV